MLVQITKEIRYLLNGFVILLGKTRVFEIGDPSSEVVLLLTGKVWEQLLGQVKHFLVGD